MLFFVKIRIFIQKSELKCLCVFRYGFQFSDYEFQNSCLSLNVNLKLNSKRLF